MDGVILDSEPLHQNAREIMYHKYGITPGEDFPNPVGRSSSGFWRIVMEGQGLEGDPQQMEEEQYRLVAQLIKSLNIPASDGLEQVLNRGKSMGMKIGLASSSTRFLVDSVLDTLNIRKYFDFTVSGDEAARKKPAPDIYENLLLALELTAQDAVAVEDSSAGIEAAHNAGIFCYGYVNDTSGDQDLSKADEIIRNLVEMIEK